MRQYEVIVRSGLEWKKVYSANRWSRALSDQLASDEPTAIVVRRKVGTDNAVDLILCRPRRSRLRRPRAI